MNKRILDALIRLQQEGPRRKTFGICFNASLFYYLPEGGDSLFVADEDGVYDTIARIGDQWPDRSDFGSSDPVGDLNNDDDDSALWDNPRRHAFLAYLIEELSK